MSESDPVDDDWTAPAAPPVRADRAPAAPSRSESDRTADVVAWLRKQPATHVIKKHTNGMGESGHPDLFACRDGRMILIEMKMPGRRPTRLQLQRLRTWAAAGAAVCWADGVHHVQELLERIDADPSYRNPLTGPGAPEARP